MPLIMEKEVRTRELPVTDAERAARVELAACYRVFDQLGWTELIFNHITLRVPGAARGLPDQPLRPALPRGHRLEPGAIDVDGNPVRRLALPGQSRPASSSTARSIARIRGRALRDAHPHHHRHGGRLPEERPVARQLLRRAAARPGGLPRLRGHHGRRRRAGAHAAPASATSAAVILRNHGLLAWGSSVSEAFCVLWTLQRACDVQVASAAMGAMNPVTRGRARAGGARVGSRGGRRVRSRLRGARAADRGEGPGLQD